MRRIVRAPRSLRRCGPPESARTLVAFFDHTGQAGDAVTEIVSSGIVPGAIEMMDRLSIEAAEHATGAGYRLDAGAALIVELDGPSEECTLRFEHVMALCSQAGARDVRVALDEQERALIWKARKAAFVAMGRVARNYYVQDGVIPRTRLAEVLGRIAELADEHGLLGEKPAPDRVGILQPSSLEQRRDLIFQRHHFNHA